MLVNKSERVPKPKRVVFALEANTRCRNRFGSDFYSQILWMRLDGHRIDQIAAALGCDQDLVSEAIGLWQAQVAVREGETFQPRRRNPRRWNNRPQSLRIAA
jgi:hypothetical protein